MKSHLIILAVILISGCLQGEEPTTTIGGGKMLEGKTVLMVIAPENFRDEELLEPKAVLEGQGATVTIASKDVTTATGMLGVQVSVDKDISEVSIDNYDAVIFIGGQGASVYFDDPEVTGLAKQFYEKGKLTAAICIAPVILGNAGLLEDKRATVWSSVMDKGMVNKIKERGAQYTKERVVVDGKIITADGPGSAEEFGRKIVEILVK